MGPWKFLFSTKEDYYANLVPRTAPIVFNIRRDPFESYDSTDSFWSPGSEGVVDL